MIVEKFQTCIGELNNFVENLLLTHSELDTISLIFSKSSSLSISQDDFIIFHACLIFFQCIFSQVLE